MLQMMTPDRNRLKREYSYKVIAYLPIVSRDLVTKIINISNIKTSSYCNRFKLMSTPDNEKEIFNKRYKNVRDNFTITYFFLS